MCKIHFQPQIAKIGLKTLLWKITMQFLYCLIKLYYYFNYQKNFTMQLALDVHRASDSSFLLTSPSPKCRVTLILQWEVPFLCNLTFSTTESRNYASKKRMLLIVTNRRDASARFDYKYPWGFYFIWTSSN